MRPTLAALAILLLGSPPSGAFVILEDGNGHALHWRSEDMPIPYRLTAANVPGGAAGEEAVRRGFDAWSAVSTNLEYRFDGIESGGSPSRDGKNVVFWFHENWPHDPRAIGITIHFFDTRTGRIHEADTVFNAEHHPWSVGGSGFDVQNAAAHEAGHVSGLGHSSVSEATMFADILAGETKKRTLHQDDVAGVEALYDGTAGSDAAGIAGDDGGFGCSASSSSSRGAAFDLVLLALLLGVLRMWRRSRIRDSASFIASASSDLP